jgi:hypothetical protein
LLRFLFDCASPSLSLSAIALSPPPSQGSFGLGLRISYQKADGSTEIFVVKRNDIEALGYRWILREKAFMHALDHPNIAKLHYQCVSPNYPTGENDDATVFFVMEDGTSFKNPDGSWQSGGSSLREYALPTTLMRATLTLFLFFRYLRKCMQSEVDPIVRPVPIANAVRIARDLLSALAYMETRNVLHRVSMVVMWEGVAFVANCA